MNPLCLCKLTGTNPASLNTAHVVSSNHEAHCFYYHPQITILNSSVCVLTGAHPASLNTAHVVNSGPSGSNPPTSAPSLLRLRARLAVACPACTRLLPAVVTAVVASELSTVLLWCLRARLGGTRLLPAVVTAVVVSELALGLWGEAKALGGAMTSAMPLLVGLVVVVVVVCCWGSCCS